MNRVFVVNKEGKALMPCHPARARELLRLKKAKVYRVYPFVIQLTIKTNYSLQPLELKYDPGSKETGVGIVLHGVKKSVAIFGAILTHRGQQITHNLYSRKIIRASRRSRHTRYRKPRFLNRCKKKGWLPPSIKNRVDNIIEWSDRLLKWSPINSISIESVKFDTQKMEDNIISDKEYSEGTLFKYEVKEYLLEKYKYSCVYCGKKNVYLEKEHVVPRSRGGSNRISNLVLSCRKCNEQKDNATIDEFLKDNKILLRKIKGQLKNSLRDVAAVNISRNHIIERMKIFKIPIKTSTGALTKFNRDIQGYKKEHHIDALCVGESGNKVYIPDSLKPLLIKKERRNDRQMTRVDKYGFPRSKSKSVKQVKGFKTGDIVKAIVVKGKKKGVYMGRVAIRKTGIFDIKTKNTTIQGIHNKCFKIIQRIDGYSYSF